MSGTCECCGKDSSDARKGGGLWLPPDSLPQEPSRFKERGRIGICADCREDQDDGVSPWRSA